MNPDDKNTNSQNTEEQNADKKSPGATKAAEPQPAKKKLSLEIEDMSETMTRLERKISP
jgi:hypothetical protein